MPTTSQRQPPTTQQTAVAGALLPTAYGESELPRQGQQHAEPTLDPKAVSCFLQGLPSGIPAAGLPSPGAPGRPALRPRSCRGPPWGPLTLGPPTTLVSAGHSVPDQSPASLYGKGDGLAATCVQATGHPGLSPSGLLTAWSLPPPISAQAPGAKGGEHSRLLEAAHAVQDVELLPPFGKIHFAVNIIRVPQVHEGEVLQDEPPGRMESSVTLWR